MTKKVIEAGKEMSDKELLERIDRAIRDPKTKASELSRLYTKREHLLKKMLPDARVLCGERAPRSEKEIVHDQILRIEDRARKELVDGEYLELPEDLRNQFAEAAVNNLPTPQAVKDWLAEFRARPQKKDTPPPIPPPKPATQELSRIIPSPPPLPLADLIDELRGLLEKVKAQGFEPVAVLEYARIIPKAQPVIHPRADV